jgi:hypothetical protein
MEYVVTNFLRSAHTMLLLSICSYTCKGLTASCGSKTIHHPNATYYSNLLNLQVFISHTNMPFMLKLMCFIISKVVLIFKL